MAEEVDIVLNLEDRTASGASSAAANAQKVEQSYEKTGSAAESAAIKSMKATERQANSLMRLAKSQQSGKNSWFDPQKTDQQNLEIAKNIAADNQYAEAQRANRQKMAQAEAKYQSQLSTARFALYDLSSTYSTLGVAASGAFAGMVGAAMKFEDAFTGVERTSGLVGNDLHDLKEELIQLSVEMPESFENLSGIATLGGQLGIAGDAVAGFSETVAMFAATTDASIDATATGFGRIAQLTGASQSSFDNIGSAIYEVGVNSVATETEIMNVAQEIATSGDLAGFSTDQIIGLSGALASLGVQPERARGNMQRIFANIDQSVSLSGENLQKFASLSGMTAEEFSKAWKDDAGNTFVALVDGLGSASAAGENLDMILGEVGIKSVRDAQTMKQLANNTDLLHMTMNDAADAYASGTSLTDAYSNVANNLSSQLKMLRNAVMSVFAALGDSSAIGLGVAALTQLVDMAADAIRWLNDLSGGFKVFGTVITTVVGVTAAFALFQAGLTRTRAGAIAFVQSQLSMKTAAVGAATSIWAQVKALTAQHTAAWSAARANNAGLLASTKSLIAGQYGAKAATDAATASMTRGAIAARGFGRALGVMFGPIGVGVALLWQLGESLGVFDKFKSGADSAKDAAMNMKLNFDGLADAVKEDTQTFHETGEAMEVLYKTADGSTVSLDSFGGSMLSAVSNAAELSGGVDGVTSSLQDNTLALGQNTAAYMASELLNNEDFKNFLMQNQEALASTGITLDEFSEKLATLGTEGTIEWLQETRGEFLQTEEGIQALTDTILNNPADDFAVSLGFAGEEGTEAAQKLEAMNDAIEVMSPIAAQVSTELEYMAGIQRATNGEIEDGTGKVSDLANSLVNSGVFAAATFEDAMYNLGASVAENGNSLDAYSVGGRENLNALAQAVNAAAQSAGDDAAAFANYLAQIYADLFHHNRAMADTFADMMGDQMNMGSAIGTVLGGTLSNVGQELGFVRSQSIGAARAIDTSSFAQGRAAKTAELHEAAQNRANKASNNASKAAKKQAAAQKKAAAEAKKAAERVYTLSDYISDLSGVMNDAFSFRWGLQQEVDNTADAFQKMVDRQREAREAIQDAKQSIRDYKQELRDLKAEMNGLKAERNTLQYQLKVAVDYGDDIRAKEIRAQLGENSASISGNKNDQSKNLKDTAKAQKDLSKAQKDAKANLKGTSESAREQRAAVLNLVSSYQDQITAVANSGMSQKETAKQVDKLKKKFEDQMKTLGYSKSEIKKYSDSFVDMKKIINNIPKNLTIKVGSPADTALRQWRKKNTGGKGLSKRIDVPTRVKSPSGSGGRVSLPKGIRNLQKKGISIPSRVGKPSWSSASAKATGTAIGKAINKKIADNIRVRVAKSAGSKIGNVLHGIFANGGYTGAGGKWDAAGIVHKGEYVFRKDQVNQSTGLPYPAALGSMMAAQGASSRSMMSTPSSFPSVMVVELSPTDRNLLAQAGVQPMIAIGDKQIASATARANVASGVRGS